MIKVWLGRREVLHERVIPVETDCRVLFVDCKANLLWLWRQNEDYGQHLFIEIDNEQRLDLGYKTYTDGLLALYRIDEEAFARIRAIKAFEDWREEPTALIPGSIVLTQSLHEYIRMNDYEPDWATLRSIAWFASSRWQDIETEGLEHVLQNVTFEDVIRNHPAYVPRFVPRNPQLFEELRRVLEARRLVFLLGGAKSGLSSFLEQFKQMIVKENRGGLLPADFVPSVFRDVQSFVGRHAEMFTRRNCEVDTTSLFCTLAYAAYDSLLESGTDPAVLSQLVPPFAPGNISEFALQYISGFARRPRTQGSQVEFFLIFVGKMLSLAGKTGKLTVVLSFPGLTNWFRETRGQNAAESLSRSLWKELKEFTLANYDAMSGQPKKGSMMEAYTDAVGIVVEIQRLPFPDINDAFCRQSVLVIPPYDNGELSAFWQQRTKTTPSRQMLDQIRHETGAAPWFVDLLADCFTVAILPVAGEESEDRDMARLQAAIQFAKGIISGDPIARTQDPLERLRGRWKFYVEVLRSRMSSAALTDRTTLLDLTQASENRIKMPSNLQAAEWLESGLIWVAHPIQTQKHTLRAFELYPSIRTFRRAALISLFLDALLQPEVRQVAVS